MPLSAASEPFSLTGRPGDAAGEPANAIAHSSSGCGPGVNSTIGLSARSLSQRGSRPARSTEDFPAPDAPNTARNGALVSLVSRSSTSRSRPKKRSASSAWKAPNPTYGGRSPAGDTGASVAVTASSAATARHRRSHSSASPAQARTYAMVSDRLGSLRPAAASDSAATE